MWRTFFPFNFTTFGSSNVLGAALAFVLQVPLFEPGLVCDIYWVRLRGNNWGRVGGPNTLPCLVQMFFWDLTCLGITLLDVGLGEHWPSHEIPSLGCLDPCGLDRIPTHHVHPLDGLLG